MTATFAPPVRGTVAPTETIDTPSMVVDETILHRNIAEMAALAKSHGVALRPHIKTHKTPEIARLQLERIRRRIQTNHGLKFDYDDEVLRMVVSRCTELESGGRMIDAILTNTMLPRISRELLTRTLESRPLSNIRVSIQDGDFAYQLD